MLSNRGFRFAVAGLVCYAALFPVLSVDVLMRLFARFGHQDRANLALLVFFESTRFLRSGIALALVMLLLGRRVEFRYARALVLFLLFGALAYAMTFGGGGYVGPFQEWLTVTLREAGLSRAVLHTLFGYGWWPTWLALGALLRFSVLFPKPLEAGWINESGRADRAGFMRGVPGAGLDVGAATRATLLRAVQRGWLNAGPVWIICGAAALASIALRTHPARQLLWLPLLFGVGLVITALRAGFVAGDELERRQIRWLGRGALAGMLFFLAAGVVGLFGDGPAVAVGVFLLLTVAPGTLVAALAVAVLLDTRRPAPAQLSGAE